MFSVERTGLARGALFGCLLVLLAALLVWTGTLGPDPATNDFAGEDVWGPSPDRYLGERVYANGIVVSTDPVVIAVDYGVDSHMEVTVVGGEADVDEGEEFGAAGTLVDSRRIEADRTNHRDRWEAWYMYAVSLVGGVWVLGRVLRDWTVDRTLLGLVPRGDGDD